jgi:hypothetical protein
MTREKWLQHMANTGTHDSKFCTVCKERKRTFKANQRAKEIRQVYADMGMKRVRGALGGVYYE